MHHGERSFFVEPFETRHSGTETEMLVDLSETACTDSDLRTKAVIGVIGIRDQCVEAVVASRQLEHDQYAAVVRYLRSERLRRAREQGRDGHNPRRTNADAIKACPQHFPPRKLAFHKRLL